MKPALEIGRSLDTVLNRDVHVILWNDPYNTMKYVTRVLLTVCGHEPKLAVTLMMIAHTHGKVCVKTCPLSEAQVIRSSLETHGLTATIDED